MALWRICFSIFHKVIWMVIIIMMLIVMIVVIMVIMTYICRAKQVESIFDASESWSNLWTQTRVVPNKIPEVMITKKSFQIK